MDHQPTPRRSQRLKEIAHSVGAVLRIDEIPLYPPRQIPTFCVPDDERGADAILGQLKLEEARNQPHPNRLSKAFSKSSKTLKYTYAELFAALSRVIDENGKAGVFEVLLRRFKAVKGDINVPKGRGTGVISKFRGSDNQQPQGRLLQRATQRHRADLVQLLAPQSPSQESLDESLEIALEARDLAVVEILLQYGANASRHHSVFAQATVRDDIELLNLLLRAPKKVGEPYVSQNLLAATTNGWLLGVLLLIRAGADGDYDNASALMYAVETGRTDIATAIVMGQKPPSGASLDRALSHIFSAPSIFINGNYDLIEVLLCGGPVGNAANEGLFTATLLDNVEIMELLLAHKADITYNGAAAIAHAIQHNRGDLVELLLQDRTLNPELASELVSRIPRAVPPADKVAILSKLLVNGASGTHCSELLVTAAEQNDLDTARLLISSQSQEGSAVCSVDYNAARCLKVAVSRNHLTMVRILALEGNPSKFSLSHALASMPANLRGDDQFMLIDTLLRAGAQGPEVDAVLVDAVNDRPRSHRLIKLLVHNGAVVTDQTLYGIVSQGAVDILEILLQGKVPSPLCALAIPVAMKINKLRIRYETIKLLLGPATAQGTESPHVSQAVIDILQNCPEDKPLLLLLCRDGKANVNLHDGLAIELAMKNNDPEILRMVLQSGGGLPNSATVERGLKCAIELQPTDPNRKQKIELLLRCAKPQNMMDAVLVHEIKSALASKQDPSVIQILLAAGANVNALDGAPVFWGIRDPAITDLLLSKPLTAQSFSVAFRHACGLHGLDRHSLCEKLLRAGATVDQVSMALFVVAKEGPPALPIMKLLLPQADINFKEGNALRGIVKQGFFEGLELLLNSSTVLPSTLTKVKAFETAMKLKDSQVRRAILRILLKVNIPKDTISDALITVPSHSDFQLAEMLLQAGASIEHNGGQAVLCAASLGQADILKLFVEGKLCDKPSMSTLTSGFSGAMTLKERDSESHHLIVQILLEAGMRGDVISAALIEAVKEGDPNLKMSELLCRVGQASVDWHEGEALDIATRSASIATLSLLLERQPSQEVLRRAYISAFQLPKETRYQVIQQLLEAGKSIDHCVANTLTSATREDPPDRRLIKLLLSYGAFDEGESLVHAATTLDSETLSLLVDTPKAVPYISSAFNQAVATESIWQSYKGVSIMELMLKSGATGDVVGQALCRAVDACKNATEGLPMDILDVLLHYGANVNFEQGLPLQRAALQVNVDVLQKLLPGATANSKAMSIPYLFKTCNDSTMLVRAMQAFIDSLNGDDEISITSFKHPDSTLTPVIFTALERFPKKPQILRALLDLGYDPNQWINRNWDPTMDPEPCPALCWALEQPEKKISNMNIELLIDEGANVDFVSKSGLTPLILAIQNQRSEIVAKLISKNVNVRAPDKNGITPLSRASQLDNPAIMGLLLRAGAECDDGSLHDAARELRCETMRVLIKYGHKVDYPSERHQGRSALAELCLNAVDKDPAPGMIELEDAVECLVAGGANIRLRCLSEDKSEKTIFHYALNSSNPMLILPVLLKMMWEYVNEDCFLYEDGTYTYSLTKYVEKDLFEGPQEQKDSILRLLRNKRVVDRFWANDIEMDQPADWCGAPAYIKEEAIRQKLRRKHRAEQEQDVHASLDLKRLTAVHTIEIMDMKTAAEIRNEREKAKVAIQLLAERANTELHFETQRQTRELEHEKAIGAMYLGTQRTLRQEAVDAECARNTLQIEHLSAKMRTENEGRRDLLEIESRARANDDVFNVRAHEREVARIKMQKSLVQTSRELAADLRDAGMNHRQIGYITGEVP